MSLKITKYICPTCKARKEIHDDLGRNGNIAFSSVPEKVPCGYRGCEDYALKIDLQKEKMDELKEILDTMDIPEERKTDLFWLGRNMGIRNSGHPRFEEARLMLISLLRQKKGV